MDKENHEESNPKVNKDILRNWLQWNDEDKRNVFNEVSVSKGLSPAAVEKDWWVDDIRQRADVNMPPVTAPKSQEEMRSIIRQERMVELAFEGQRFFDIRRYDITGEVMNGTPSGMTYTNAGGELVTVKDNSFILFFDPERDHLWPVPQKELDLNPDLTQNPGW